MPDVGTPSRARTLVIGAGELGVRVLKALSRNEHRQENTDDTMKKYRAVFAHGTGVAWDKSHTFNARRNIPTTTAKQWAADNLGLPEAPALLRGPRRDPSGP